MTYLFRRRAYNSRLLVKSTRYDKKGEEKRREEKRGSPHKFRIDFNFYFLTSLGSFTFERRRFIADVTLACNIVNNYTGCPEIFHVRFSIIPLLNVPLFRTPLYRINYVRSSCIGHICSLFARLLLPEFLRDAAHLLRNTSATVVKVVIPIPTPVPYVTFYRSLIICSLIYVDFSLYQMLLPV